MRLKHLFGPPFIGRVEVGGGGPRAAAELAKARRKHQEGADTQSSTGVSLLNSAESTPQLEALCMDLGIELYSLGRHECAWNIICPMDDDRCIILDDVDYHPDPLADRHRSTVIDLSHRASAVATCSSQDAAVTAAAFAHANGCPRFVQATGSLGPDLTLLLLACERNELICNWSEACRIAGWLKLRVPPIDEVAAQAPWQAARLLLQLHRLGLANGDAAVITLGRAGAVVGDWENNAVHYVRVVVLDGPHVATPAGAGDKFLAKWIWARKWADQGILRDPIKDGAARALRATAHALRLRPECFDVLVTKWGLGILG